MATAMNPLLTGGPASTAPSSTPDNGLLMKWAAALLGRFAAIWPKAWADSVAGLDPAMVQAEWAKGLAGLTGEEIRDGIDHCRTQAPWPPSIAEFRGACRGGATAEQRAYAARATEDRQALANGTWGDTAAVVTEHVQAVKAKVANRQTTRSLVDIAAGRWTRAMEANFCYHAGILGRKVKPIEWPDEAMA